MWGRKSKAGRSKCSFWCWFEAIYSLSIFFGSVTEDLLKTTHMGERWVVSFLRIWIIWKCPNK